MDSISPRGRSRRDFLRNILTLNFLKRLATLLFALLLPLVHSGAQRSLPPGYINDNSDWWSSVVDTQTIYVKVQHRLPPASNFQILGITLDGSRFNDFHNVTAKLGNARVTSRSDGADARDQICYVSSGSAEKVHLIFEMN
jgi:hypothetical protein